MPCEMKSHKMLDGSARHLNPDARVHATGACWVWDALKLCFLYMGFSGVASAQPPTGIPEGLSQLNIGRHLTLITDLPIDDEIQQLPILFDQAMQAWSKQFLAAPEEIIAWRATVYLMLDRQRFRAHGLIPLDIPEFQHGWQSGDRIWIQEQPSPYYRRHLMLHEGTHWFMFRKYGRYHAPWLMEGLAEWMGTHRLHAGQLELGIVPRDRLEVPFWGRISILQDQTAKGVAPGMDQIWRYSDSAHQQVDAYAWSWAMVLFLNSHPETAGIMSALLRQPAMDAPSLDRWLRSRLRSKLPRIRAEWNAFVSDLDYGYSADAGMLRLSEKMQPLPLETNLEIQAQMGWQATGFHLEAQQKLEILAEGQYSLASDPKPWISHPDGVTLDYHRGQPIGKLMMTVLGPIEKEPETTRPLETIPIGSRAQITPQGSGELFFRVNESNGALGDNSGSIRIRIRRL